MIWGYPHDLGNLHIHIYIGIRQKLNEDELVVDDCWLQSDFQKGDVLYVFCYCLLLLFLPNLWKHPISD